MFEKFKFESISLSLIDLDYDNPRIVNQVKLTKQNEVISYLFEHENLLDFIKEIAVDGKNKGAERPYVVAKGPRFVVVEGNTRIAAYQILAGLACVPAEYDGKIPVLSDEQKNSLLVVDCSVAPNRAALLPIMARSHFGAGDKVRWGYLGSRKAVYDEYKKEPSLGHLAKVFDRSKSDIIDYILEYLIYQEATKLIWSHQEREILLNPNVMFNPPVRFLETQGHKELVGIELDRVHLEIKFTSVLAKAKFQHLVRKLVVSPSTGLGATATYGEVFSDFVDPTLKTEAAAAPETKSSTKGGSEASATATSSSTSGSSSSTSTTTRVAAPKLKPGALFNYPVTKHDQLLVKLMTEAKSINANKLPASGTFLVRNIVEVLLKVLITQYSLNPSGKQHDLESALNLCIGSKKALGADDVAVLSEFKKTHLGYLNLGAHGAVVPNAARLMSARDCIDVFIKKHI